MGRVSAQVHFAATLQFDLNPNPISVALCAIKHLLNVTANSVAIYIFELDISQESREVHIPVRRKNRWVKLNPIVLQLIGIKQNRLRVSQILRPILREEGAFGLCFRGYRSFRYCPVLFDFVVCEEASSSGHIANVASTQETTPRIAVMIDALLKGWEV